MPPAHRPTTAQPHDNVVLSETEPESDEDVTMGAAGPSAPSTVLPPDDLSVTEPESDEDPQLATVSTQFVSHPSHFANKQSRPASSRSSTSSHPSDACSFDYLFLLMLSPIQPYLLCRHVVVACRSYYFLLSI
jgi:hypothetical protein